MCIRIHTCICICICMCMGMCICMGMCMCICICMCMYMRIRICMIIRVRLFICICIGGCVCAHTHTHTHTHAHTHTHTHTHARAHTHTLPPAREDARYFADWPRGSCSHLPVPPSLSAAPPRHCCVSSRVPVPVGVYVCRCVSSCVCTRPWTARSFSLPPSLFFRFVSLSFSRTHTHKHVLPSPHDYAGCLPACQGDGRFRL